MYQIKQLVDEAVKCFEKNCTIENVCLILNEAVLFSLDELINFSIRKVNKAPIEVLKQESFTQLSTDALNVVLTHCLKVVPNNDIFHAVINWMKANPTKSADFPGILMNLSLRSLTLEDLAAIPSGVLDVQMFIGLLDQQKLNNLDSVYKVINENVAVPKNGVRVVAGGENTFFQGEQGFLVHQFGQADGIIIDLGHRYMLNYIKMVLVRFAFSYIIQVSEDNVNWTVVIDHSKYPCRNLQNLYFETRPVRFIRICCTASSRGDCYVSRFEAYCTNKPFEIDAETKLLIPSENVAIPEKYAVMDPVSYPEIVYERIGEIQLDFPKTAYKNGIIVQLFQPYVIDSIGFEIFEGIGRAHGFIVEVSVDCRQWTRVFDGKNDAYRKITFDKQPVAFIKIVGMYGNSFTVFPSYNFECPAVSA